MWELLLLPIMGFFISALASLTGVGGGIFIVPLLTLVYSFTPINAVGTSLATILIIATAATVSYSQQKRIHYKIGLLLATTTIPGALAGAFLSSVMSPKIFGLTFGFFLVIVSLRVFIQTNSIRKKTCGDKSIAASASLRSVWLKNRSKLFCGLSLGFFGGVASGLLGVGGGIIIVPIMTLLLEIDIHVAVATSMFTMIVTSLTGVLQYSALGNVNFGYAILLGVGAVIGAQIGALTSKRLSGSSLQLIFGAMLLAVSVQMILKFI